MAHTKMRIQDGDIRWVETAISESIERRIVMLKAPIREDEATRLVMSIARLGVIYIRIGRVLKHEEKAADLVSQWTANASALWENHAHRP